LIPKHSHGTYNFTSYTSSSRELIEGVLELFDEIVNPDLYVRRLNVTACKVITEKEAEQKKENSFTQMNLLEDFGEAAVEKERHKKEIAREKKAQEAILKLKKKYGKNAVVKGMNLEEGATTIQRNAQIGGHKA
jgi:DNA polymerase V